jgi:triose/dihydroxyacetone kinase / FAD-AMP lyase (cyclizing)
MENENTEKNSTFKNLLKNSDHLTPKYFLSKNEDVLNESLKGLCMLNKNLLYFEDYNIIVDKCQLDDTNIKIISGGGSGHEPAHAGYVAKGFLSAAVCGDIFSSPSYKNVLKAIEILTNPNGFLLVVKNYTGDIINFKLAMELARQKEIKIEMLIVDDDIAFTNLNEKNLNSTLQSQSSETPSTFNKKRGLCGTVLLYKILGDLIQQGKDLNFLKQIGQSIINSTFTLGVSLTTPMTPFSNIEEGDLKFNLSPNLCEVGLGIHGEKGKERMEMHNLNEIINHIFKNYFEKNSSLEKIFKALNHEKDTKDKEQNEDKLIKNEVCLIVNNLGSLTDIEMNVITYSIINYIEFNYENIKISKIIHGRIMTSLDMKGFSLTIFSLDLEDNIKNNKDLILTSINLNQNFLNQDSSKNIEWKVIDYTGRSNFNKRIVSEKSKNKLQTNLNLNPEKNSQTNQHPSKVKEIIEKLCHYLIDKCDYLNELDKIVGDGDLGIGVEKTMKELLSNLNTMDFYQNLKSSMKELGEIIASSFGGTSGPLYASFLLKGSDCLSEEEKENKINNWIEALIQGTEMIAKIGGAKLNDRTMLDYLIPLGQIFNEKLSESKKNHSQISIQDFKKLYDNNNEKLLYNVKNMKAKRGRSSYLQGKEVGHDEPGCVLVSLWVGFIINYLSDKS